MNQEKFASFITQRRKQLNLTQKDIAEKLHVSISAVSKYERGLSYPDITLLEPLSQILEVTIVDLLSDYYTQLIQTWISSYRYNTVK